MIFPRRLAWLFALFLLLGQQAGALHQLGHGLGDAGRVIAALASGAAAGDAGGEAPESATHAGSCLQCVGFGGVAVAPSPPGLPPAPGLGFARPLAAVAGLPPFVSRVPPIRGPPERFSRPA